jgi:hypothetical protein
MGCGWLFPPTARPGKLLLRLLASVCLGATPHPIHSIDPPHHPGTSARTVACSRPRCGSWSKCTIMCGSQGRAVESGRRRIFCTSLVCHESDSGVCSPPAPTRRLPFPTPPGPSPLPSPVTTPTRAPGAPRCSASSARARRARRGTCAPSWRVAAAVCSQARPLSLAGCSLLRRTPARTRCGASPSSLARPAARCAARARRTSSRRTAGRRRRAGGGRAGGRACGREDARGRGPGAAGARRGAAPAVRRGARSASLLLSGVEAPTRHRPLRPVCWPCPCHRANCLVLFLCRLHAGRSKVH